MNRIGLSILLLQLAACGSPRAADDYAHIALALEIAPVNLRPYAASETEDALKQVTPEKLLIMVCDNIKLSSQVKQYCSVEQKDYHFIQSFNIKAGKGVLEGVPPARNQILVAQGLDAGGRPTFQGVVTMPVIEPRVAYHEAIKLGQIVFPSLPPPQAPTLVTTSAQLDAMATTYTFEGSRIKGTRLRVEAPSSWDFGGTREFRADDPPLYDEALSGDKITWSLIVNLPINRSTPSLADFTFDVAREGEDLYSEEVKVRLSLCADASFVTPWACQQ